MRKTITASLAFLSLAVSGIVFAPAAQAADGWIDPSSITITKSTEGPVQIPDVVEVSARWSAPAGAAAGDTFSLALPSAFDPVNTLAFDILTDSGETVGTCAMTSKPTTVTCTMSDFVKDKEDIQGNLSVKVKVVEGTTTATVPITIDGAAVAEIPLPGGAPIAQRNDVIPLYTRLGKWSYGLSNLPDGTTHIVWQVGIPSTLASSEPAVVTDSIDQTADAMAFQSQPGKQGYPSVNQRCVNEGRLGQAPIDQSLVSFQFSADLQTMVATIDPAAFAPRSAAIEGPCELAIWYDTVLDGSTYVGDIYKNNVSAGSLSATSSYTVEASGGGTGSGSQRPVQFTVSKQVTGDASSRVPATTTFTINYTANGQPYTLEVPSDGTAVKSPRFPAGTEFVMSEGAPPTLDGIRWAEPSFEVDDAVQGASATFTPAPGTTAVVDVTNSASRRVGSFEVTSVVDGDGASLVDDATTFTVDYSYQDGSETVNGSVTVVKNGAPVAIGGVPAGSVLSLTERTPADVSDATWSAPVFSVDGAPAANPVQVTIAENATSRVEVTNTITKNPIPPVSVGDFVWRDLNGDGIQDAGEPGIEGVTLTITGPGGAPVTSVTGEPVGPATSDSSGRYAFAGLPALDPGERYSVTVDSTAPALAELEPSPVDSGSDRSRDSSAGTADSGELTEGGTSDDTVDFGFVEPAKPAVSIGDLVWLDVNSNGIQDAEELGIAGVTVTIVDDNGEPVVDVNGNDVLPIETTSDGTYRFTELPALLPGDSYFVSVDQASPALSGLVASPTEVGADRATDSSAGVVEVRGLAADGDSDDSVDFGFAPEPVVEPVPVATVSVGNLVWRDSNADGLQDAGERGISDVPVTLHAPDGTEVGTATTDVNGLYEFVAVPALTSGEHYTVTVDGSSAALTGLVPSPGGVGSDRSVDSSSGSADSAELTTNGAVDDSLDFGFTTDLATLPATAPDPTVSVGDFVWLDANADGLQGPGERGIANVTLTVSDPAGETIATVISDNDGNYVFEGLPALETDEHYTVAIDASSPALAGLIPAPGEVGADRLSDSSTGSARSGALVDDKAQDDSLDFGFVPEAAPAPTETATQAPPVTPEPVETPAPTETATPTPTAETTVPPTPTAEPTVPPTPEPTAAPTPEVTAAPTPEVAPEPTPTATPGPTRAPSVAVGDLVWSDLDGDGVQEDGEPGLPGVRVTLAGPTGGAVTDVFGSPVASVTTSTDGGYEFLNLPPLSAGEHYTVTVDSTSEALAGLSPSPSGVGDAARDSSAGSADSAALAVDGERDDTLDFGYQQAPTEPKPAPSVSIGDFVWDDTNHNGVQDAGEPGLPGVPLTIVGPDDKPVVGVDGKIVDEVTTDEDGEYLFIQLPVLSIDESYTVAVVSDSPVLENYVPTKAGAGSDPNKDSSTGPSESSGLTSDGAHDDLLDFGFVTAALTDNPTPRTTAGPKMLGSTGLDVLMPAGVGTAVLGIGISLFVIAGARRRRVERYSEGSHAK